jgi:uncharacterized protein YciI
MKLVAFVAAFVIAAPVSIRAQRPAAAPSAPPGFEIPKDITTYYVAIYVRGPKYRTTESPEDTAHRRRHLAFIRAMIEQKKYLLAGPLTDGGDKQGLAIVAAASMEEAKRIAEGDPTVAAGHMAIELHPAMLPSLASLVVKY